MSTVEEFYASAAKDPEAAGIFRAAGCEKTAATIEMVQAGYQADRGDMEAGQ